MKNFLNPAAWIVLGFAIVLAACEGPSSAPPVTLRIGVLQALNFLPYFVMQEQGFDRKNGLRFEEPAIQGGAGAIDAMVAGSLDLSIGVTTVPLLVAAERGLIPDKVVPVATNSFADREHPAVGVLAASSVRGWKDLEGKKIGINDRNSMSAAAMDRNRKSRGSAASTRS